VNVNLGGRITKDGNHEPEINDRISRGRAAIPKPNSILLDRDVTSKTKTHIYQAIAKSTITYAAETGCLKAKTLAKLNSTEMDFWRRSARISRKDKIRNGSKLPKEVMKWRPPGRRKRGKPKLIWAEGIKRLMGEKGFMKTGMTELEEEDNIIVKWVQEDVKTL
jgi:hypothetical protein